MNTTTVIDPFTQPNYPYLSGYLQAEMASLAYDNKFFKLKNPLDRMDYLQKLIDAAKTEAVKYQMTVGN